MAESNCKNCGAILPKDHKGSFCGDDCKAASGKSK